jgi:hypothetical protein
LLLYNDAGKGSANPMDGIMKKSINPEDTYSKPRQNGDVIVPRDFMIKTAYERKRRSTHTAQDNQSTRSRQSSAVSIFTKASQQANQQYNALLQQ